MDNEGDVTGSPCQPWSRIGVQKGVCDDRTSILFAWMTKLRRQGRLWSLHENVPGFRTEILDQFLGQRYHLFHIKLSADKLGLTVARRPRLFTILYRKGGVEIVRDPQAAG